MQHPQRRPLDDITLPSRNTAARISSDVAALLDATSDASPASLQSAQSTPRLWASSAAKRSTPLQTPQTQMLGSPSSMEGRRRLEAPCSGISFGSELERNAESVMLSLAGEVGA